MAAGEAMEEARGRRRTRAWMRPLTRWHRARAAASAPAAAAARGSPAVAVSESSVTQATPRIEKAPSSKTAGTSVTSRHAKPITVVSPEISTGVDDVLEAAQRGARARPATRARVLLEAREHVDAVDAADRDQIGREDHGQDRERLLEQRDRAERPDGRDQHRGHRQHHRLPRPEAERQDQGDGADGQRHQQREIAHHRVVDARLHVRAAGHVEAQRRAASPRRGCAGSCRRGRRR